jgi:hypothetical protein
VLHDFTYAACGLQAILEQAIDRLGYPWDYDGHLGQYTTHGHQYCLKITQNSDINNPTVGYIYGRPCPRRCEARESALAWALHYIDNDRGYTIRDIQYYWQWRQVRVASGL